MGMHSCSYEGITAFNFSWLAMNQLKSKPYFNGNLLLYCVRISRSIQRIDIFSSEWSHPDCVFPFTYNGVKYNGCTDVDNSGMWCATSAVFTGNNWVDCTKQGSFIMIIVHNGWIEGWRVVMRIVTLWED